ncbi:hypothetical protein OIU77_026656 [Salix suchowensis]|uniref:Uncharacterized protein n=1 Tax=Salix suchowensis TaxID=1278906 RepID=A0ABQ9BPC5_9ROSI|nr:hypothetical protein OIU77_026656 [Salix suchowensis]
MDIDPFWITGGCFIITDLNFMATARSLSVFENTAKLQAMVLFSWSSLDRSSSCSSRRFIQEFHSFLAIYTNKSFYHTNQSTRIKVQATFWNHCGCCCCYDKQRHHHDGFCHSWFCFKSPVQSSFP